MADSAPGQSRDREERALREVDQRRGSRLEIVYGSGGGNADHTTSVSGRSRNDGGQDGRLRTATNRPSSKVRRVTAGRDIGRSITQAGKWVMARRFLRTIL